MKLFSWVAAIALVIGAAFFLKYSVEHGWLNPAVRMAIGLTTGVTLLALCEWKKFRPYSVTANALDAAGIAILFSTFYAAHSLWDLLSLGTAFCSMALVAAVAVMLSLRRDSLFIALLGLAGGFATPALLSTGEDRAVTLFSYLLLVNAGLAWVAYRKRWPYLTALSVVFTTLYQGSWVWKFLSAGNLPLALGIFLVFPALSFAALTLGERRQESGGQRALFRQSTALSAALPLMFAIYLAAVPSYGGRYLLLFGFLFLVAAGWTVVAARRGSETLHAAGGLGTLLTFVIWLNVSYTSAAWPGILAIVAAFLLLYVIAPLVHQGFRRTAFVAPLLLLAFPALAAIEPAAAAPGLLFGVLGALAAVLAAYAVRQDQEAIHWVAAVFVFATQIVWSARHLTPERLLAGLTIYTLFALFYLVTPVLARNWAMLPLALTGHVFVLGVACQQALALPPWPFLGVLVALNLAIGVVALYARRGEMLLSALGLSQIILIAWQVSVAYNTPWPEVAILCAAVISALGLAWFLFTRRSEASIPFFAVTAAIAAFLGEGVTLVASAQPGSPSALLLAAAHACFLGMILAIAWLKDWHFLAVLAVIPAASAANLWRVMHFRPETWWHELVLAGVIYAVFLAYPVALGGRVKSALAPHQAAVFASVPFFFLARHSLLAGGFADVIGLLPVTQAALMAALLWRLLRLEPPGQREQGRLALVAAAALAFITVAIPLQLEKQWITIGWALLAAALAALYTRIPHQGLLLWCAGLITAVFLRLVLNPAIFHYHPRGALPIWNWYLYTYLVSALAFFAAAWFLRNHSERLWEAGPRLRALAAPGGAILLFLLLNIEIADYFSQGTHLTFDFSAGLAQDLTYTIGWALFAFGLLGAAIPLHSKAGRVAAIGLLSLTTGKCFLHDLWSLGGLYRVGSFVGLALCLTLVALLLQKFVLQPQKEAL